jgi:hypothetical protein
MLDYHKKVSLSSGLVYRVGLSVLLVFTAFGCVVKG